jgi:hypothetical protein
MIEKVDAVDALVGLLERLAKLEVDRLEMRLQAIAVVFRERREQTIARGGR